MGKFLKKNWFVLLVILIFTGISIYYIYDTNKGKLKGKTAADGGDVVYSVNDTDVTADEFYDSLYKSYGTTEAVTLFEKAVANASVKTTNDMKDSASSQASSIISNYESSYGSSYETYLRSDLASLGYTDLEDYLIDYQKILEIEAEYAKANFEDLNIHEISYILIQFEETDEDAEETTEETEEADGTPTEDEQSRMDAVDAALKESTFAEVAAKYSEDSSTASSGGVLGVIDKNTSNLDSAFLEAALALNEGEVSDWVYSENFGYFRIYCTASTAETLEANNADSDPYLSLVSNFDTSLRETAIWAKASELGVDFKGNEDLEDIIKEYYGASDESTESTTSDSTESSGGN